MAWAAIFLPSSPACGWRTGALCSNSPTLFFSPAAAAVSSLKDEGAMCVLPATAPWMASAHAGTLTMSRRFGGIETGFALMP